MPVHKGVAPVASNDNVQVEIIDVQDPWSKLLKRMNTTGAAATGSQLAAGSSAPSSATAVAGAGKQDAGQQQDVEYSVDIDGLSFSYPGIDGRPLEGIPPVVQDMTAKLKPGSCCLLIGPNGAGKTTLLKTIGGKHMIPKEQLRVLGLPPFHATELTTSGGLSYIGGNWERDVAFAGYAVPLQGDFPASQMLSGIPNVDPKRRERLIEVLDINPNWRMHMVSDGQRRRVQLACGLLREYKVLLLDEITVDLDVLGRADLMAFLKDEAEQRGATIIYATHIFDGLESWPTHLMYVARGRLQVFEPAENLPELKEGKLLELVEKWLRAEHNRRMAEKEAAAAAGTQVNDKPKQAQWNNGWAPGRLNSTFALSSNTVMRM